LVLLYSSAVSRYLHSFPTRRSSDLPNTARLQIGNETDSIELTGISIGGGKVEITELNGFELRLSGNHPAILIMHNDRFGAIASVDRKSTRLNSSPYRMPSSACTRKY